MMANLVQKFIVHGADEASSILPQHVALVTPEGDPFDGASNATTNKPGLVKKASVTDAVASPDATAAASETVTKAEFDAVVTLLNECKAKLNDHLTKAKSSGQMA